MREPYNALMKGARRKLTATLPVVALAVALSGTTSVLAQADGAEGGDGFVEVVDVEIVNLDVWVTNKD